MPDRTKVKQLLAITLTLLTLDMLSAETGQAKGSWKFASLSYFRTDLYGTSGTISGGEAILAQTALYSGTNFNFCFSPRFSLTSGGLPQGEIASLYFEKNINDSITIQVGKFAKTESRSVLFSADNFFAGLPTPEAAFNGTALTTRSEPLIRVSAKKNLWSATSICAPFKPVYPTISPASPLFQQKGISNSYTVSLIGFDNVYFLRNIVTEGNDNSGIFTYDPVFDPAVFFEGKFDAGTKSIALSYFYGKDRSPVITSKITKLLSDFSKYDISLKYSSARIHGFGISSSVKQTWFDAWAEGSFISGRYLLYGDPYKNNDIWQETKSVPVITYAAGFSATPFTSGFNCGFEWKNTEYLAQVENPSYPFLDRAFLVYSEIPIARELLLLNFSGIYSLRDGSCGITGTLKLLLHKTSAELSATLPFGNTTSDLGQFGNNDRIYFSLLIDCPL